ncbi:hypothetical protein F5X97DRAFT_326838 [Nemania serpens]|nr:hypothetical protein F5X97DRAFT_326838 [Nemania serpens]
MLEERESERVGCSEVRKSRIGYGRRATSGGDDNVWTTHDDDRRAPMLLMETKRGQATEVHLLRPKERERREAREGKGGSAEKKDAQRRRRKADARCPKPDARCQKLEFRDVKSQKSKSNARCQMPDAATTLTDPGPRRLSEQVCGTGLRNWSAELVCGTGLRDRARTNEVKENIKIDGRMEEMWRPGSPARRTLCEDERPHPDSTRERDRGEGGRFESSPMDMDD